MATERTSTPKNKEDYKVIPKTQEQSSLEELNNEIKKLKKLNDSYYQQI